MRKFKSVESYKNLSILFGKNFMKQKVELVIINIIKVYFDFCRLFISEKVITRLEAIKEICFNSWNIFLYMKKFSTLSKLK